MFEALRDDALGLEALAAKIAIPRRTARICADAMVALGLLERDGDLYRNSPVADAFLTGQGHGDLRPFLRYLDVSYRAWAEFTSAIRAGQGSGFITRLDPETQRLFSAGVESATAGSATALAENYEFSQHRRLLDLGGGTGSFLVRILDRHPAIECGLFELPQVVVMARENLKAQTSSGRVRFYEGDLLRDRLPTGYDAFLLANCCNSSASGWPATLAASLAQFVGHLAYGLAQLRDNLERFVFLVGGSDGEQLFGP